MSSHNVYLFTLSYALFKSRNISPRGFLACILYCTNYYTMSAYSIVVYFFRKPAYVGACSWFSSAVAVNRLLMIDINNFANGGATAILR
jgi:hypothetical protein